MKILFLTAPDEDYLAISLLHGLRSLLGADVVDFPRAEVLYRNASDVVMGQVRGFGFTLCNLLEDIPVDRYDVFAKVKRGHYDLVVFSNIQRQFGYFAQLQPWLTRENTIILDGEDVPSLYPYNGSFWRQPTHWLLPRAHTRHLYFKREWTADTLRYRWFLLAPKWVASRLPAPRNLRTIAFSIQEEKIVASLPEKRQEFPRHIVDEEVQAHVPGSAARYAFEDERAYYGDLQASRWGVTTIRAGWDCLRHYEIAANAAVPVFRDLDRKPATCAPHGLDAANSVSYGGWDDLRAKLDRVSEDRYAELQAGALAWARRNTTTERARQVLDEVRRAG